jgi:membrane fusion protein (multidrug efflux system)
LANEGIVPKKDAESAAADAAKAKSDEVAARRAAEQSVIRAPIAGVVTRMSATMGAQADASQSLVEIADPHALDIVLNLTPTDAARVRSGMKVTLSAGQDASGEPIGVGAITEIAGTVDSTTRGVSIRAEAPTTRRPLRIGETVFGAIAVSTRPNAIVVPTDAVVPEGDEFHVFVVDQSQIAHERPVKVGGKTATQMEIVEGLKAGERIVTTGAYGVQDSAKVAPPGTLPSGDDDKADADSSKGPDKGDSAAKGATAAKSEDANKKGVAADTASGSAKAAPKVAPTTTSKPAGKGKP